MCGILGLAIAAPTHLGSLLRDGLRRMQYRGYDSCGILVQNGENYTSERVVGDVSGLPLNGGEGTHGIAHTRWATHGAPSQLNTHPIASPDGRWWVVHNGVLTNHAVLRNRVLEEFGLTHATETDTEVFVTLAQAFHTQATQANASPPTLPEVLQHVLKHVDGSYAVILMSSHYPDQWAAACNGSPLLLGRFRPSGELRGCALASDPIALADLCDDYVRLHDGDVLHVNGIHHTLMGVETNRRTFPTLAATTANKGLHAHFMIKEILEQPEALRNLLRGRLFATETPQKGLEVRLGGLGPHLQDLANARHWVLLGCGSSFNAAYVAQAFLQDLLPKHTFRVSLASEFMNASDTKPPVHPLETTAYVFVSQSGESKDLLDAARHVKQRGGTCFGIHNRPGSALDGLTTAGLHLNIGPECAVAATKSFTAQVAALVLVGVAVAEAMADPKRYTTQAYKNALHDAPDRLQTLLDRLPSDAAVQGALEGLVQSYAEQNGGTFWAVGDGWGYGVAREIALKFQEVAYIPMMAHVGVEVKHGPLALLDAQTTVLQFGDKKHTDALSPMLAARGGARVMDMARFGIAYEYAYKSETCLHDALNAAVLGQWWVYHVAYGLGRPIDQPRHLAKSVTV